MSTSQSQPQPSSHPYSLALTGGIGCGKSTVGKMLQEAGLLRVDADQVARDVVAPGSAGLQRVVDIFGSDVLAPDGSLDRRAVGRRVFASATERKALEAILHPLIWEVLAQALRAAEERQKETVFEIPLLFENGNEGRFSTVWVVTASPQAQTHRLAQRDGLDLAEIEARIASQMSVLEKAARATYVIANDGDLEALRAQVARGLEKWRAERSGKLDRPGPRVTPTREADAGVQR